MITKRDKLFLLFFFLTVAFGFCFVVFSTEVIAQDRFHFQRMWPTLKQPWYFQPWDVAVNEHGTVYVLDRKFNHVYKFTLDGRIVTRWGTRGSGDGEFDSPKGIAVDNEGNVYVSDPHNHRILKFTAHGELIAQTTEGEGSGDGQISDPGYSSDRTHASGYEIALDSHDRLYLADKNNNRVQVFDSDLQYLSQWDGLTHPQSIAVDSVDRVFVSTGLHPVGSYVGAGSVNIFSSDGQLLDQWTCTSYANDNTNNTPIGNASGIAVDEQGYVYLLVNLNGQAVHKYAFDGTFIEEIVSGGPKDGHVWWSNGIEIDKEGYLIIADSLNYRVQKHMRDGQYITQWGCGASSPGRLHYPLGLAFDTLGNLYVADSKNVRIQKFTSDGRFLKAWNLIAGNQSLFPEGLAVDDHDDVYVADRFNDRIQKFDSEGTFIQTWGTARTPTDIAIDSGGSIYVTSEYALCVEKYTADGALVKSWRTGCYPRGIAIDSNDDVYVVERGTTPSLPGDTCSGVPRVVKYDSEGRYLGEWGGVHGQGDGEFYWPYGITIDQDDHVYVMDMKNNRVQIFDANGNFLNKFGELGNGPGQLNEPHSGVVAEDGRIYISDTGNSRIQVFKKIHLDQGAKAVIVAGGGPYAGNNLWEETEGCANFAYRTLIHQGLTKNNIHYLSSDLDLDYDDNGLLDDVDADATNANLQDALVSGVSDAASVVLYLVDHGDVETFRMSGTETLSAADLDAWLDTLQSSVTGQVTVIYDACHSGSFLSALSGASRTVITSTSPEEAAKFVSHGAVSFSNYFWTHVFNGESVGDAFSLSEQALAASFDDQTPLLDANGNGAGNEPEDYDGVSNRYIGNGTEILGDAPVIASVSDAQTISGTTTALLTASGVTDPDGIARVWAVIRPPDLSGGDAGNPVLELPTAELMPRGGGLYAGSHDGFNAKGTYLVAVYALDGAGNTSIPKLTTVSVDNPLQRKAVIMVGGRETDEDWPAFEKSALQVYEALKGQGYADDDITFMSPVTFSAGVDSAPSWSNAQHALTTWAQTSCQDVVVYLVGRGSDGAFELNEAEALTAGDLDTWLDELQGAIPGKVTLVYDASFSGSFLPLLTPPPGKERIVIASTEGSQQATFAANGDLSFSKYFWKHVLNGMDVRDAFIASKNAIWYARGQNALLDDNGDGVCTKPDGQVANGYRIGAGILLAGDAPVIGSIATGGTIYGTESTIITVDDVTTTGTIERVWAVVSNPTTMGQSGLVPAFELTDQGGGRYQGFVSGLTAYGKHEISVYAMDTDGEVSMPAVTSVWQGAEGVSVNRGDINGDGDVNTGDAVLALEIMAGANPQGIRADYVSSGLDVNGDSVIGMEEVLYIMESGSGLSEP